MSLKSRKSKTLLALATISCIATFSQAFAWDNCGVGYHRNAWGRCISNYAVGPGTRGCFPGFHLGAYTHACFPN
jgi:hypothetical protein